MSSNFKEEKTLNGHQRWAWTHDDVRSLDPLLYEHKVKYLLENDVEPLCLDFTDVLHDAPAAATEGAGQSHYAYDRRCFRSFETAISCRGAL